jgi:hypothetical protein
MTSINKYLEFFSERFLSFAVLAFVASFYLLTESKDQVFYILFPIAFILTLIFNKRNKVAFDPLILIAVALITLISISSLWSSEPGQDLGRLLRHGVYIALCFLCFYFWLDGEESEHKLTLLFDVIIFSSLLVVLMTFIFDYKLIGEIRLTHRSLLGLTDNPIHSGFFVGVAAFLSFHLFRKSPNIRLSSLAFFLMLVFFLFVLFTKSRGAIIFLIISFLMHYCLVKPIFLKRDIFFLISILIGVVFLYFSIGNEIVARLSEPYYRIDLLTASLEVIKSNFWFGTGVNLNDTLTIEDGKTFSKVHNTFIQVFQVSGVFAFLLLSVFTVRLVIIGLRSSSENIKVVTIWFIYGSLYLAVDGGLLVSRPSYLWFNFWMPAFVILTHHLKTNWIGLCQEEK